MNVRHLCDHRGQKILFIFLKNRPIENPCIFRLLLFIIKDRVLCSREMFFSDTKLSVAPIVHLLIDDWAQKILFILLKNGQMKTLAFSVFCCLLLMIGSNAPEYYFFKL